MNTIKARLTLSAALIFFLVSLTSLYLVYTTRLNDRYLSREQVVEKRLDALEHLAVRVYHYFKQIGDSLLFDEGARRDDVDNAWRMIQRDLAELDRAYESSSPALDTLVAEGRNLALRKTLEDAHRLFAELEASNGRAEPSNRSSLLANLLDERIDRDFRQQVDLAIDAEREMLRHLRTTYRDSALVALQISAALGSFVAMIVVVILVLLYRSIKTPLRRLGEGTRSLADGREDTVIDIDSPREIAELAESFNDMSRRLAEQRHALVASRATLAEEVARQTVKLKDQNMRLKELDDSRKRLLLDVGHELRTPLTVIQGEVDIALAKSDTKPQELVAALRHIAEVVGGINRLVNDLFLIVRADFDPAAIIYGPLDYRVILGELYDAMQVLAARKSIHVSFDLPERALPANADRDRIKQALTAVFDNAIRYSHRGGRIRIEHQVIGGNLTLRVIDEGIGIDAGDRERVFERFFRSERARRHSRQGSGLGLSVADSIVRQHGGTMNLEPNPHGVGTLVEICLPLASGATAEKSPA